MNTAGKGMAGQRRMVALHKHWLHADSIRVRIRNEILTLKEKEKIERLSHEAQELLAFGGMHSTFLAICIWYALLYVVIEGYRETGMRNEPIDNLLAKEEYVDVLRRFRNAIFHYQEEPLSDKLLDFLVIEDSEIWIKNLNSAFDRFFKEYLPINNFLNQLRLK